jgi:pimeloyl-ACP methyl ester carboxylesterase
MVVARVIFAAMLLGACSEQGGAGDAAGVFEDAGMVFADAASIDADAVDAVAVDAVAVDADSAEADADLPDSGVAISECGRSELVLPELGAPEEARARIRSFLGTRPAPTVTSTLTLKDPVTLVGTTRYRAHFRSEAAETIPGYVFLPNTLGPHPAVLAFHQTSIEAKEEAAGLAGNPEQHTALEVAELGYAVFVFDSLAAGERAPVNAPAYDTREFYARHPDWSAIDKAIWDGARALDAFCLLPEVDCDRVAALGHSQGGIYAWMLAADDPRVDVVIVSSGYTTFRGDPDPRRWARDDWWIGAPALRDPIDRREFPFEFHEWLALIAPRPLWIRGTCDDPIFPAWQGLVETRTQLGDLYRELGAGDAFELILDPGDHAFPLEAHLEAWEFLARWL